MMISITPPSVRVISLETEKKTSGQKIRLGLSDDELRFLHDLRARRNPVKQRGIGPAIEERILKCLGLSDSGFSVFWQVVANSRNPASKKLIKTCENQIVCNLGKAKSILNIPPLYIDLSGDHSRRGTISIPIKDEDGRVNLIALNQWLLAVLKTTINP